MKATRTMLTIKPVVILIIYLLLLSFVAAGQVPSNVFFEREYIQPDKINKAATHTTFFINKEGGSVLVLKDLITNMESRFDKVGSTILTNDHFLYKDSHKNLIIKCLKENKVDTIKQVARFYWDSTNNKVIYYKPNLSQLGTYNLNNSKVVIMDSVVYHQLSDNKERIVYVNKENHIIFKNFNTKKTVKYTNNEISKMRVKKIVFSENQKAYIFTNNDSLFQLYQINNRGIKLAYERSLFDEKEKTIIDTLFVDAKILKYNKIALYLKKEFEKKNNNTNIEIWHGSDQGISPVMKNNLKRSNYLAVIDLLTKKCISFYNPGKLLDFKIASDHKHVFVTDLELHEDLTRFQTPREIAIYNMEGIKLHNYGEFSGNILTTFQFQNSQSLFYFKDNIWKYYDMTNHKKHDLIKKQPINVSNEKLFDFEYVITPPSLFHKKEAIFQIQDELFLYNLNTRKITQKTNGGKFQRQYKVSDCNYDSSSSNGVWYDYNEINEYEDLILQWNAPFYETEGIALLKNSGEIIDLSSDAAHYYGVKRLNNKLLYIKEKTNQPPILFLYDIKSGKERVLYKTNSYDEGAKNVKSYYHKWQTENGEQRGAIIRLPENYDKKRKYPTIVDIYEKKYKRQHFYQDPFQCNDSGINYRQFIADGYFVIEPDIYYEVGNPGGSALKCVSEAITELSKEYNIDEDNMGLFGHSFGAYEANFIITKTNRFKTAVSWSGVSDIISSYMNYNTIIGKPDFWKYETHQYRMGKSFFEMTEEYFANSPIFHVKDSNTPLLLITGTEDNVIPAYQSKNMFLSLKRIGKETKLLLYKNEGHSILKGDNKKDVFEKIKSWFDFYLKNKNKPNWF